MELKLYNTTSSKLDSLNIVGGQLIVSKDDSCLYVDIDSIGRLKITDWIELETDNDRLAVLAPISGKIYHVSETNAIWKYVKGSWKCLNEVNKEEIFEYVLENLKSYLDAKVPTSRKINGKVLTSDIALSAADVGAATTSDIATAKTEVNKYTDDKIALLVNNSSTAIDSINELAKAMEDNSDAISTLESIASGHALKDHEHNYAGSSSVGGSANSAVKLDSSAGSALQPVFFENGKPKAVTHTLNATVPADAKFTDTIYTHPSHEKKDSGLYKVGVDSEGHVFEAIPVTKSDITSLGIPAQDTTYTLSSFGVNATSTELNYVDGVTSSIQNQLDDKVSTSRKINGKSLTSDITLSASDVGALTASDISTIKNEVNSYTDQQIANLLNNSTEAVDSIYELRDAMEDNADAIESLVAISGNKANTSDLTSHINNKNNPHNVTKEQLGLYVSTWSGSRAEYNALTTKQDDCLYIITDESETTEFESISNKVTVINSSSDDKHYPSAKAVYQVMQSITGYEKTANKDTVISIGSDDNHYPTSKAVYDNVNNTVNSTKETILQTLENRVYGVEKVENKVTEINEKSKHTTYPTAAAVWDLISTYESKAKIETVTEITETSTDTEIPSAKAVHDFVVNHTPELPDTIPTVYTGTSEPDASLGKVGDIYFVI